jgi:hypothetical protein
VLPKRNALLYTIILSKTSRYGYVERLINGLGFILFLSLQGIVESDSIEVEGTQAVRIKPVFLLRKQGGRAGGGGGGGGRGRSQWPSGVGSFLRFVLAKENCDTALAMSSLAKYFRCNDDSIKYAGTKDKRGVTFQYVTVFRKKPSEVNFINRFVYRPLLRVGNYKFGKFVE